MLALTRKRGEELGEVESCVGGLQNIFLDGVMFFHIMVAKEDFFRSNRELFTGYRKCAGYWCKLNVKDFADFA